MLAGRSAYSPVRPVADLQDGHPVTGRPRALRVTRWNMSRDPVGAVCPKCGSDAYAKRGSTRVCQSCSTGYRQPTPFWQRELPGGPYLIPGLLLSLAAGVGLVVVLLTPAWSKLDEKGDLTFV